MGKCPYPDQSCFGCLCWGSYNTGGIKYCLCGYEKIKKR